MLKSFKGWRSKILRGAPADGFSQSFCQPMKRPIGKHDRLLGVMGLDEPVGNFGPKHREVRCLDHRQRQIRMFIQKTAPWLLTLSRKARYFADTFSSEGIAISVLHEGVRNDLPCAADMRCALRKPQSLDELKAWRACRYSWGLKAARHLACHGMQYGSYNLRHILALHEAMTKILGPLESPEQTRRDIRKALLVLHPDRDALSVPKEAADDVKKGRIRLRETLMSFYEILEYPSYCRVMYHPGIKDWGQFSFCGSVWAFILAGAICGFVAATGYGLALGASAAFAFGVNELRLYMGESWQGGDGARMGFRAWMLASRYTGRVLS